MPVVSLHAVPWWVVLSTMRLGAGSREREMQAMGGFSRIRFRSSSGLAQFNQIWMTGVLAHPLPLHMLMWSPLVFAPWNA
jgi:hypothetical protein